jgi:chromosome segregation ATPase
MLKNYQEYASSYKEYQAKLEKYSQYDMHLVEKVLELQKELEKHDVSDRKDNGQESETLKESLRLMKIEEANHQREISQLNQTVQDLEKSLELHRNISHVTTKCLHKFRTLLMNKHSRRK